MAPFVSLLPPHAPWAVLVLTTGGVLAWRGWKEEYTILYLEASCPRCDAPLEVGSKTRLRFPHPLTCDDCHHEPVLKVGRGSLLEEEEGEDGESDGGR